MHVTLQTRGYLQQMFPEKKDTVKVELAGPATVREILGQLAIQTELVMVILSGGVRRTLDYIPQDGETVVLIPPVSGG